MTDDEVRRSYISLLRGMLSSTYQTPSASKINALIKAAETVDVAREVPPAPSSDGNRRRLTALVVARTKLEAASQLVKESTIEIAGSGLLPVEVREDARKIAEAIDAFVKQRITSTIEHIP